MNATDGKQEPAPLIRNVKESYGERFQDHLLEQYKLYVESSQKISANRITAGNYLLAINSSLLSVFAIAFSLHITGVWLAVIPCAGFLVSVAWYSVIISYKNLNTAKFTVIHELEEYLPAALFAHEWQTCDRGKGKAYTPITHLEKWIPLIFAALYVVLSVFVVCRHPL